MSYDYERGGTHQLSSRFLLAMLGVTWELCKYHTPHSLASIGLSMLGLSATSRAILDASEESCIASPGWDIEQKMTNYFAKLTLHDYRQVPRD